MQSTFHQLVNTALPRMREYFSTPFSGYRNIIWSH